MTDTAADTSLPYPQIILPHGFDFDFNPGGSKDGLLEGLKVCTAPGVEYEVTFITAKRLAEEVDSSRERNSPWFAKPAMIVVSHITGWIVDLAVRWAYGENYFLQLVDTASRGPKTSKGVLEFPGGLSHEQEDDAFERHYLQDGVARLNDGSCRPAYFQTPTRLSNEIEGQAFWGTPLFVEPGLIAVAEVRLELCRSAVATLAAQGFFDHLKPQAINAPGANEQ